MNRPDALILLPNSSCIEPLDGGIGLYSVKALKAVSLAEAWCS